MTAFDVRSVRRLAPLGVACLALALGPLHGVAQERSGPMRDGSSGPGLDRGGVALTALAGPAPYDLSGTGTATVAGVSAEVPIVGPLGLEAGVRALRYRAQSGNHISHLMPELGLRGQVALGRVRPYLGVGLGPSFVIEGAGGTALTLHGAVGARVRLERAWALRPEVRFRSIRPWTGTAGELTLGVSYFP